MCIESVRAGFLGCRFWLHCVLGLASPGVKSSCARESGSHPEAVGFADGDVCSYESRTICGVVGSE